MKRKNSPPIDPHQELPPQPGSQVGTTNGAISDAAKRAAALLRRAKERYLRDAKAAREGGNKQ
jgi:hypothetical protein